MRSPLTTHRHVAPRKRSQRSGLLTYLIGTRILGAFPSLRRSFSPLVIVLANGTVIFTIARPRNKGKLRTPLNLLILQLAIVDLLIGGLAEPLNVYYVMEGIHNAAVCAVYLSLSLALDKASMVGFIMISVERFVAIRFPFQEGTVYSPERSADVGGRMGDVFRLRPDPNTSWPGREVGC